MQSTQEDHLAEERVASFVRVNYRASYEGHSINGTIRVPEGQVGKELAYRSALIRLHSQSGANISDLEEKASFDSEANGTEFFRKN